MIECTRYKENNKGAVLGFADFYLPAWGIEINGCSLCQNEKGRWVNLPSKMYTNSEGEKKFAPYIRFKKKEDWERFCNEAKEAVDRYNERNVYGSTDQPVQTNDTNCLF